MDDRLAGAKPWIKGGYVLTVADLELWASVSALYVLLSVAVAHLPFVGDLILVLYTPAVIAGVLKEASHPHPTIGLLGRIRDVFVGPLRDHKLALPVMSVATVLLGASVLLSLIALIFGVEGFSLAQLFAHRGPTGSLFTGILLLIFWGLHISLMMTALYVLAAVVLGSLGPVKAFEQTLGLWRGKALVIATLGTVFVLPLILASYSYPWVYFAVLLATSIPLILAVYGSYDAFARSPRRPASATRRP